MLGTLKVLYVVNFLFLKLLKFFSVALLVEIVNSYVSVQPQKIFFISVLLTGVQLAPVSYSPVFFLSFWGLISLSGTDW